MKRGPILGLLLCVLFTSGLFAQSSDTWEDVDSVQLSSHLYKPEFYTYGNDEQRQFEKREIDESYWDGMIVGIYTTHPEIFCSKNIKTITNAELIAVVYGYIQNNPTTLHEPAQITIDRALAQAYPCVVTK